MASKSSKSRASSGSSARGSRIPGDFAGSFGNPDDFCNSFWDDNGYEVLSTRMRHSSRTMEELRAFYKEKAAIEEEYGKKMSKLARMSLGKHEMGNLKLALDRVRQEVARSGDSHEKLAVAIRTSLVSDLKRFDGAREDRRKAPQAVIDKLYKERARQEALATKAKDKYKADCISINGLTAQTNLTQGRDLDKVQQKLEKHEATVQVNKSDYEAYTNALGETFDNWNAEWRSFSDLCQDLEEERMDFLRLSLWDFANAMSLICVTDDESCEEVRRALERFQTAPEIADVARTIGTGAKILDAPTFVDYGLGHHDDASRRLYRTANFPRQSARKELAHSGDLLADLTTAIRPGTGGPPTPMEEYDPRRSSRPSSRPPSQQDLRRSSQPDPGAIVSPVASSSSGLSPAVTSHSILAAPSVGADGSMHRAATPAQAFEAAAVSSASRLDPPSLPASMLASSSKQSIDQPARPPSRGAFGSIGAAIQRRLSRGASSSGLDEASSPPYDSISNPNQPSGSASRAVSSSYVGESRASTVPAAAFKRASTPQPAAAPEPAPAQDNSAVIGDLAGGEEDPLRARLRALRTLSNSQKRTSSPIVQAAQAEQLARQSSADLRDQQRPPSRGPEYEDKRRSKQEGRPSSVYGGYASRGASPAPEAYQSQQQYGLQSGSMGQIAGQNRYQGYAETSSRAPLGIALDSRGQVIQDSMADDYARRQQEQAQQQQYAQPADPSQRSAGYKHGAQIYGQPAPQQRLPQQSNYAPTPPQQDAYASQYGQRQPALDYQPARQSVDYRRQSGDYSRQQQYEQPVQQQYAQQEAYGQPQRSNSQYGGQQQSQINGNAYYQQESYGRAAQQAQARPQQTPPPAPVDQGQTIRQQTDGGRAILFYVQALYDYTATIQEEFSFEAGDIIAVFQTDPDGWWQGELLDQIRKLQPGKTFPSNFTQLLK